MQALNLNRSTRTLSVGYFFSKRGEFAFETAFAVAVVSMTEANLLLIGMVYFFRYLPSALFFAAAIALQFHSRLFLAILFVVGFVGAFVDIAIVTNIQCLSDDRQMGRNFSLYYFTAVIGDAVSGLIASLVFVLAGPATFIWMTLMLFVAPLRWNMKGSSDDAKHRAD
ncbi:hypothetical protein PF70_00397 [Pseudomonas asplenii]|nr:hypothetical protein [Pseudomonas fuscovaginae]KPA99421.1 hypothetical protein PF70_00397 [Pseudomonas fuscovaginae]